MAASLDVATRRLASALNGVGVASLVVLLALTVVDVGGRYLFNRPLLGALELSEFMLVFLVFCGLAYTDLRNGHVTVDVVVERFPPRLQGVFDGIAALLGTGLWAVIGWRSAVQAEKVRVAGEVSSNLVLPIYPFIWTAAIGSSLFACVLLIRALKAFARAARP